MASGLFQRLQAPCAPQKSYGFEAVDRDRERAIVQRLTTPEAERRRPEPSDAERRQMAAEAYARALFRRLGRSHTFSSRCKQRNLDPHRMCSGQPGEMPDYRPIRDLNVTQPPTPPPERQQQQQQRTGPSLATVVGLGRLASRARKSHEVAKQQKRPAGPFGLVFRAGGYGEASATEKPVTAAASTAVFGAVGRMRYRAKRPELEQRQRDLEARKIHSSCEIVNATEFVRNYERQNRVGMQLARLARPTTASSFKAAPDSCPFCREQPELAVDWQRRLASGAAPVECSRCGRLHETARGAAVVAEEAPEEEGEDGAAPAPAEANGAAWGSGEEAALVARLLAPTRASEGGVPFCRKGRLTAGSGLGVALVGFEAQRPKSAIERVRSAQKRKELIDAMSVRLHSGRGGGSSQ